MTSFTDHGFVFETPAAPVRNNTSTDNGGDGRMTFSQRIAWRNGSNNNTNNTVVTPATAMETPPPVTPAATEDIVNHTPTSNRTDTDTVDCDNDNDDVHTDNPYESILQDASQWKRQLESARDEIYFLQVQNAMHLDYLTMAAADE
jgi:hypothetical protein